MRCSPSLFVLLAALLALAPAAVVADEGVDPETPPEGGEADDELGPDPAPALSLDLQWKPAEQEGFVLREALAMQPGALRVVCGKPGARVELDGEPLGEAPQTRAGLEPGLHAVSIILASGKRHTQHVFVQGGMLQEVSLRTGTVADERASFAVKIVSGIAATAVAILAGVEESARINQNVEMPGLITNGDVRKVVPGDAR